MTKINSMSLRQLCDTTELLRLQAARPFSMTDVRVDGSTLRAEFSDRIEGTKKKRMGLLYETSEVQFDCGSDDMAQRWSEAMNGGQKISATELLPPAETAMPSVEIENSAARKINPPKQERVLLDAKIVFNAQTRQRDQVRLRYSAKPDGTIPYETLPFPCADSARAAQQEYAREAKRNVNVFAAVAP